MFLIGGVVKTVLDVLNQHAVYLSIRFGEVLVEGSIVDCSVKYDIELTFFFSVGLMFVLSCVFEHGTLIQKEADGLQCNNASL